MSDIVLVKGKVEYTITLDPGVWIFDDRKVDLHTYFSKEKEENDFDNEIKRMSSLWDKELEGASTPPIQQSVHKFEKEKVISGSFGIPLRPFLVNAVPTEDASKLIMKTSKGDSYEISLDEAFDAILGFSDNGKPLKEDGPIHLYYGDGSNQQEPFKNITTFILE